MTTRPTQAGARIDLHLIMNVVEPVMTDGGRLTRLYAEGASPSPVNPVSIAPQSPHMALDVGLGEGGLRVKKRHVGALRRD